MPLKDLKNKRVWVAGETGLVGRAVTSRLKSENCEIISAAHDVLDLTDQRQTYDWMAKHKPDVIIMAAGKVGGIGANSQNQAEFLFQNLSMAQNVIHGAFQAGVENLLYLGSSCIYPKMAEQPIKEDALLTRELEPTNEGYALAKIMGLKLCQYYKAQYSVNYISAMPTNLYGPFDRFDEEISHVIASLILKIHKAKIENKENVTLWGTGAPLREFLYNYDLAEGLIHLLKNYDGDTPVNIGSGKEISIQELAQKISSIVGYEGRIEFDTSKPDGTPRKLLDSSKINQIGWRAKTPLDIGLQRTYDWFLENVKF